MSHKENFEVIVDRRAVGSRLLGVRQNCCLSQIAFSKRLGVSIGAYQGYERGEREAPSSMLWTLYNEFGVDPLWILGGVVKDASLHPDNARPIKDAMIRVLFEIDRGITLSYPGVSEDLRILIMRLAFRGFASAD